jgi:hypothetical protein
MKRFFVSTVLIYAITSCSTASKSMLFGATVGSLVTTGISMSSKGMNRSEQLGLVMAGTALGTAAGYLDYDQKYVKPKLRTSSFDASGAPSPLPPTVRRLVIPDRVEGNRLIKSHEVFIIEQPSTWGAQHESR